MNDVFVVFMAILTLLPYIPYPVPTGLSLRQIDDVCKGTVAYVLSTFFIGHVI